jgi:hypothetical protein
MPILVRPVREQLEHDRVIRLLQAKYKRKFDAGMNPGTEQSAPVGVGASAIYPDLVLQSTDRSKKLLGVVEVETGESVNNLEAMSQWVAFGKLRTAFHLYVPSSMIDVARRLCQDLEVPVAEIWTYHPVGDQIRFTLVQRAPGASDKAARPEPARATRTEPAEEPRRAPARPEPARSEPARAARGENGRAAARPAAARAAASTPARRPAQPAAARHTAAAKGRSAKAAPARGRATVAKKKAAPARSARTQKRK